MLDLNSVLPKDYLVLHHSADAEEMKEWEDKDVRAWMHRVGKGRTYADKLKTNPNYDSRHRDPDTNAISYAAYNFVMRPYTKDGNKYGWRITANYSDAMDNTGWHCGNWAINTKSVGICVPGDWRGRKLPELACMLLADFFRPLDQKCGHKLKVVGHMEIVPTACPGGIMDNKPMIIDMINNPSKYEYLFTAPDMPIEQVNQKLAEKDSVILNLQKMKETSDTQISLLTQQNQKLSTDLQTALAKIEEQSKTIDDLSSKYAIAIKRIDEQNVQISGLNEAIAKFNNGKSTDTFIFDAIEAKKLEKIITSQDSVKSKVTHISKEIGFALLNWGLPSVGLLFAIVEGWLRGINENTVIFGATLGASATIIKSVGQILLSKGTVIAKTKAEEAKHNLEVQ